MHIDLALLRQLSAEHDKLAWLYAEAYESDDDADRLYAKLRDLEQEIAAEVSDLFDMVEHPMPKLTKLMSEPSIFEEDR
jgi:hypothetical protein